MSVKLTDILKDAVADAEVAPRVSNYEQRYGGEGREEADERKRDYENYATTYYDLVTDFYEYGWGQSFHFAPRAPHESFPASLARHEHYMAHMLGLRPGMVAADLGCGVGGPLREMIRFSGAKIVGLNNNAYQLERARKLTEAAGLSHLAEFLEGDFMQVEAPDASFDAVFAIEATCHAPSKEGVFAEAFRLLKPGGHFGSYEFCITDRYDAQEARHRRVIADIMLGGALQELPSPHQVDDALRKVGFELLTTQDRAVQTEPGIPWYQPLVGSGFSLASFRSSRLGRWVTHRSLRVLEALRFVPRGTVHVSDMLNFEATALAEAGRLGIFTPMYFVLARKPESCNS